MQEESQQGTAKDPKEEEKRESLRRCSVVSKLWFERLSAKLKTPLFLGILIIGLVPAIALWSLGISIRIRTDFTEDPITSLLLIVLNVTFLLVSSNHQQIFLKCFWR